MNTLRVNIEQKGFIPSTADKTLHPKPARQDLSQVSVIGAGAAGVVRLVINKSTGTRRGSQTGSADLVEEHKLSREYANVVYRGCAGIIFSCSLGLGVRVLVSEF